MSQGGNNYEQALELLTKTISAKISDVARKMESISTGCLYRVPEKLRKLKESAYIPQLIAIGPLHQNDKHLQTSMQQVKMSYANHLLCRLTKGIDDPEQAERTRFMFLQECVAEMKTSIDRVKKCYTEDVTLDEEMMFIDGCFILELLSRLYEKIPEEDFNSRFSCRVSTTPSPLSSSHLQERSKAHKASDKTTDLILDNNLTAAIVLDDLLLLENQIPFFVLEKLFELTLARIPKNGLNELKFFIQDYVSLHFGNMRNPEGNSTYSATALGYYHILHKIHEAYAPQKSNPDDEMGKKKQLSALMPSASELDYAGVKFVRCTGKGKDQFNVKFTEPKGAFAWCHRARFEIPTLGIYDSTEPFFRNLIAFEQCCPEVSQHFSSYAYLVDMLVNSEKDVQVLEKAGVVRNYLGSSKDVADLFNNLCKEIIIREFSYADMCSKAKEYSEGFWPKNLAHVRRTYLASPWTFIAFILGFIVFCIQVVTFVKSFLDKCTCN